MNTEMILSDIDELGIITMESSIEVLDTMIEFYDKSMNILNNDRTGNGSSIIQETAIFLERDESIITTIALAIPRLIAALIRNIRKALLPAEDHGKRIDIKKEGKGPFDVAYAAIDKNPDLIMKVGSGLVAGAGALKIWTANKAKIVKEKVDEKKAKLASKAISKAKYVEYKNKANDTENTVVRIIVNSPTDLSVYTSIQALSDIEKSIEAYVSGITHAVDNLTRNMDKGEKRKDFEEQLEVVYNTAQYPAIISDFCGDMGYYEIYKSPESFINEIDKILNKGIKSYEEQINALSDSIKTAFDYYDDTKLVNLSTKKSRDTKNTKDAVDWCVKLVKAVTDNLNFFIDKFKTYKRNCENIIKEMSDEEKTKRGKGNRLQKGSDRNNIFTEDNTTNLKNYCSPDDRKYDRYLNILNRICTAIPSQYGAITVKDSAALFKWDSGIKAPLTGDKIIVKAEQNGINVEHLYSFNTSDGDKSDIKDTMKIFLTMSTRSGVAFETKYADIDDSIPSPAYPSKTLFENIEKSIEGG